MENNNIMEQNKEPKLINPKILFANVFIIILLRPFFKLFPELEFLYVFVLLILLIFTAIVLYINRNELPVKNNSKIYYLLFLVLLLFQVFTYYKE